MIHKNILEGIGNTPFVRLNRITKNLGREVLVRVEGQNPRGSIKIRPAISMVAAVKGYGCTFIMPDCMSGDRIKTIRAYNSEVILTPSYDSIIKTFAAAAAKELVELDSRCVLAGQFVNQANCYAHYTGTGKEIIEQM